MCMLVKHNLPLLLVHQSCTEVFYFHSQFYLLFSLYSQQLILIFFHIEPRNFHTRVINFPAIKCTKEHTSFLLNCLLPLSATDSKGHLLSIAFIEGISKVMFLSLWLHLQLSSQTSKKCFPPQYLIETTL
jgi:hypothetical protein